jgi:hypothetical protein
MGPVVVVVGHPGVDRGLGLIEIGEDLAVEKLAAQRLVEPLDLARRRRRPRRGEQVLDAVLPADPIEEHLAGSRPEPAGEDLAVVREDLRWHPWRRIARANPSHTGRAVARRTTSADTQNREWSSIPDTIDAFQPSASINPPTVSSCHSSMALARSHRL